MKEEDIVFDYGQTKDGNFILSIVSAGPHITFGLFTTEVQMKLAELLTQEMQQEEKSKPKSKAKKKKKS